MAFNVLIGSKHRKIMEWLSSVDPSKAREAARKSRASGTGVWFTQSKIFQNWIGSATSSILWLSGISMNLFEQSGNSNQFTDLKS